MTKTTTEWRARRKQLTEAILTMYTSSASRQQLDAAFQCYHPAITYIDAVAHTESLERFEAQFRALRSVFQSFRPLRAEITGDFDKITIDATIQWSTRWYSMELRHIIIAHISDCGLGSIVKHEDMWSWFEFWAALPVISFIYRKWRPWFGLRTSQVIIKSAEAKNDPWLKQVRQRQNNETLSDYQRVLRHEEENDRDVRYAGSLLTGHNGQLQQRSASPMPRT